MTALVPLAELFEIRKGRKPSLVLQEPCPGGQRLLQINDLRHEGPMRFTPDESGVSAEPNDVLIAWDGANAGTVGYGLQGNVGSTLARLRPITERTFTPYVGRFLQSRFGQLSASAQGAAVPHVNRRVLETLRLPLPPLTEQRRIAGILDTADAIRRKRRESLRLLDGLLPAAFLHTFGDVVMRPNAHPIEASWRVVTVEEIAARNGEACVGGPFGSSLTRADYISSPGVPVIRGNNLIADRGVFHDDDFVFVSNAKAETLSRNVALPGDIVLTQRGTLGQVAQIPRAARYTRYVISQSQMKIKINEEMADPRYVVHYFLSPRALQDLRSRTLVTGVPHINLSILKAFPIVLPPLALQQHFGTLVSRHQITRARIDAAGQEMEQLFGTLEQQAFRGGP